MSKVTNKVTNKFKTNPGDITRLGLSCLFCVLSQFTYSQIEVGTGFVVDNHTFIPEYVELPDDVIITTVQGDPRTPLFISKPFHSSNGWIYSLDLLYHKKFQSMFVGKASGSTSKRSHIASGNIQFLGNIGLNPSIGPLRKFKILVGLGPSFYFSGKPYWADFTDYPELNEPFYQSQKIHR